MELNLKNSDPQEVIRILDDIEEHLIYIRDNKPPEDWRSTYNKFIGEFVGLIALSTTPGMERLFTPKVNKRLDEVTDVLRSLGGNSE